MRTWNRVYLFRLNKTLLPVPTASRMPLRLEASEPNPPHRQQPLVRPGSSASRREPGARSSGEGIPLPEQKAATCVLSVGTSCQKLCRTARDLGRTA